MALGASNAGLPGSLVHKWWDKQSDDPDDELNRASALITETAAIEQYQSAWHELNLWNAVLYSNRELVGFNWGVVRENSRELWPTNLHTENIIEEVGEALLSKACSSPMKPTPVPHGNNWKTVRAVRMLDKFILAVWTQTCSEDACTRAFLDSYISSIGCVQDVYDEKKGTLHCEPVFFDQLIIDNREAINRQTPRTYRIRRVLPVASIEARWGIDFTGDVRAPVRKRYVDYREVGEGWEVVVEAWRLPDAKGKGGRHTIACYGHLLLDEPWKEEWVPLEFFHWRDRLSGFFCCSGVEQMVPYQVRQNELNDAIRESQDIVCRPRILAHANTQLDLSQWDNEAGRILMWSGAQAPIPFNWSTNLGELYQERDRNKAAAFSHAAMSEMFANADIPNNVRLDSSAGVREFLNMQDARHLRQWTRYQDFRLRVAKMHLRVLASQKGAEAFSAYYHPARSNAKARTIPYAAVKQLTEDQYGWTLEASSMSQMIPASRRETLRDWVSRGLVDSAEAHRMLTVPNLERDEELEEASYDDVDRHIELLEDEKYEAPSTITNLTYGIKAVVANIHRLRCYEDVPAVIITNHLMWVQAAVGIQQSALAQAQDQTIAYQPTQGMPGTSAATSPHTLIQNMAPAAA